MTGELAPSFDTLLGDELRRVIANEASEDLSQAVDEALGHRRANADRPDDQSQERELAPEGTGPDNRGD